MSKRTLWLLLGLAPLAGTAGCSNGGDDQDSRFVVDWSLVDLGPDGTRVTCKQAETPTVDLKMTNVDTKMVTVDTFTCPDNDVGGTGLSRVMPPGSYEVGLYLKNAKGRVVSYQEREDLVGLSRNSPSDLRGAVFPIQSFVANWTITRGGQSRGCNDPDVQGKTVNLLTRRNSDDVIVYSFACQDGGGVTPAIELGTYTVDFELVNTAGAAIWRTNPSMTVVVDQSKRAVLPPITFDLQ